MNSKSPAKGPAAGPTPATAKSISVRKPRVRKNIPAAIASAAADDAVGSAVPLELIAQRAYELFIEQGAEHGHDIEHWLAAERELLARV